MKSKKKKKLFLFVCIAGRHRSPALQILTGCALQACGAIIKGFELLSYPEWKNRGCKVVKCRDCCIQTREAEVELINHIIMVIDRYCGRNGFLPDMVSRIMACADYSKKFYQGDDSRPRLKPVCIRYSQATPAEFPYFDVNTGRTSLRISELKA